MKKLSAIDPGACVRIFVSSAFLAFGLYHVHALSGVTEGGVLGLNLLLEHWFGISPAITNLIANGLCFALGWHLLGRQFILHSAVAAAGFSLAYALFEQYPPLWPGLYEMPLLASVLGALFVGIGTGLCVRDNAAVCGDDALAMCVSHVTGIGIQWVYLSTDLTVLLLSATYIPLSRLVWSFLTVFLSGQIIGLFQRKK